MLGSGSTLSLPKDLSECLESLHVILSKGRIATHHQFELVGELRVPSRPKQKLKAFPLQRC